MGPHCSAMFRYRQGVALSSQHMLSYWQPGALSSSRYSKQHGCVTCIFATYNIFSLPSLSLSLSLSFSLRSSSSHKPLPLVSLLVSLTLIMTQSWHSYALFIPAPPHLRLTTVLTSSTTFLSYLKGGEEWSYDSS